MATAPGGTKSVKDWIDLLLPLFLTGLLIALCFQLLLPFVGLLLWTIILAVCFNPLQEKLLARGWKPGRAAMLLGGVLVAVVLVPTVIAAMNAASGIPTLVSSIQMVLLTSSRRHRLSKAFRLPVRSCTPHGLRPRLISLPS